MAELCRECFIEIWRPSQEDIDNITMSDNMDFCEGCNKIDYYVESVCKNYIK